MGLQPTNAGIDFQQRVSAFMMILMEFGINVSSVLRIDNAKEKIEKIDFEACESIDDLILNLESGRRIYLQMKRTISLSDDSNSEFYKVCKQFVNQSLKNKILDMAYILMTRSEASSNVVQNLRRVLDGIRLSQNLNIVSSLNNDEKNAFDKFSSNIKKIYKDQTGSEITEQTLLSICLKTYVETLDIETGESFEKTICLMLYGKLQIDPITFWEGLIARAVDYGAKRRSITAESLKNIFDIYLFQPSNDNKISATDTIREYERNLNEFDMRFDYVVCKSNEKTQNNINNGLDTVFLFELYRFEGTEKRKYKYVSPNMLFLQDGMKFEVLCRCSTESRCDEYLKMNCTDIKKINKIPANKNNLSSTIMVAEKMHKELLLKSLEKNCLSCNCINCGKAITDKKTYLIEIDNSDASCTAGLAHKECIRPIDRVLGEAFLKISDKMIGLNKFDVNKWVELIMKGKTVWNSMEYMNSNENVILVNDFDVFDDGNYCICNKLENGGRHYITSRGKIQRFGKKKAKDLICNFKKQMEKIENDVDCFGYSSISMAFCTKKQCKYQFPNEDFIKIIDMNIEPYNNVMALIYNDSYTFYAPLIYFSIDGEPLILKNGIFPLITDPMSTFKYIDNWKKHYNDINDFEMCIIENDNEFILKISRLIMQQIRPVVNPIIVDDKEVLGIPIQMMWEIEYQATSMDDVKK